MNIFSLVNEEQAKSFVRWVVTVLGPILAAHGVAAESTIELWGGVALSIVPLVWGLFAHTDNNMIGIVDKMAKDPNSGIKAIITDQTPRGVAIAKAMPGETTVVDGSQEASVTLGMIRKQYPTR
jgi:hypothetical protein